MEKKKRKLLLSSNKFYGKELEEMRACMCSLFPVKLLRKYVIWICTFGFAISWTWKGWNYKIWVSRNTVLAAVQISERLWCMFNFHV